MKTEGLETLLAPSEASPKYPRSGYRWEGLPEFTEGLKTAAEVFGEDKHYPDSLIDAAVDQMKESTRYQSPSGSSLRSCYFDMDLTDPSAGSVPYFHISLHRYAEGEYKMVMWGYDFDEKRLVERLSQEFTNSDSAGAAMRELARNDRAAMGLTHDSGRAPSTLTEEEWDEWAGKASSDLTAEQQKTVEARR